MKTRKEILHLSPGDPSHVATPDVVNWLLVELVTIPPRSPLVSVIHHVGSRYRTVTAP